MKRHDIFTIHAAPFYAYLLLLVTVARGSKVPGAACSPFQSALTNHLLKWRTIMTTINLKRYYPYMTENVMLESMLRGEIKYYLS